MTHGRVMRFVPVFDMDDQATSFAAEHALAWIGPPARAMHRFALPQE